MLSHDMERAQLRELVDKLKAENEELKQRWQGTQNDRDKLDDANIKLNEENLRLRGLAEKRKDALEQILSELPRTGGYVSGCVAIAKQALEETGE